MKSGLSAGSSRALQAIRDAAEAPRRTTSDLLLGARRELLIVHNGREYRLRVTQHGRLILTA